MKASEKAKVWCRHIREMLDNGTDPEKVVEEARKSIAEMGSRRTKSPKVKTSGAGLGGTIAGESANEIKGKANG